MTSVTHGKYLGLVVTALGLLSTFAALTLPAPWIRPEPLRAAFWIGLFILHASLHAGGALLQARFGMAAYLPLQATAIFALGVSGVLFPVVIVLSIVLVAQAIAHYDARRTTPIIVAATALLTACAIISSGAYQGATTGMWLIVAALGTDLTLRFVRNRKENASRAETVEAESASPKPAGSTLTPREAEILKAIASGARSAEIATQHAISERTVKAHLANIYQKLGVSSRSGAVAVALRRGLV